MALLHIGKVRRFLFLPGSWWWNGWVRDVTARFDGSWLIGMK